MTAESAGRSLSIIIPAKNESGVIGDLVAEVRRLHADAEILVVNDGSDDDTAQLAEAAGATVLSHPVSLGNGAAVKSGARAAGGEILVMMDGDGQHRADEIDRLLGPLERNEADVVLGSRFAEDTGYHAPPLRRLGMLFFSAIVSRLTGQRLRDTTSGFRASGRRALEYMADHYPVDYPEVEALVLLSRAGFRVVEVPCRFREREAGRSSITGRRSVYYVIKVLLAIFVGLFRRVPEEAR